MANLARCSVTSKPSPVIKASDRPIVHQIKARAAACAAALILLIAVQDGGLSLGLGWCERSILLIFIINRWREYGY